MGHNFISKNFRNFAYLKGIENYIFHPIDCVEIFFVLCTLLILPYINVTYLVTDKKPKVNHI